MKKVIIHPEQTQTILIDSITNDSIVGIEWYNKAKSWIVETDLKEFKGIKIGSNSVLDKWHRNSKKEYCVNAMTQRNTNVFVFDTADELVKWLKS